MKACPRKRLLLFARYPVPGLVKTRLIPALGAENAARLHRRLAEHAAGVARAAGAREGSGLTVVFTGAAQRDFRSWLGDDLAYAPQCAGDIGVRMRTALASAFRAGARQAVVIGTDIPDLSPDILQQAFAGLRQHDVVLGPAADGGYYLIGVKADRPGLFAGIPWSSNLVCAQTRAAIDRLGLTAAELPQLRDVDVPEDASALRTDPRFADVWTARPLLSVIIPTLDEAPLLGRTLELLRRGQDVEIIVVDGGSRDGTRGIAAEAGAAVLAVAGGRAAQQNAGAAHARGRHLLFLHADTLPPDGYVDLIRCALASPAIVAGAFRFKTDGSGAGVRLVEWGANIRSARFRWPYGDQGLFMEKRVFEELGGFAPLPIMEDFELVSRLRRRGPVVTLDAAAVTSARRWRRLGALRTTARNLAMVAGFRAGVPPERLARYYRGGRSRLPDAGAPPGG